MKTPTPRKTKNGALHVKTFPDTLRDFMATEIEAERNRGGALTSYGAIIQDALLKRYADERADQEKDDKRITQDITEKAGVDESWM